MRRASGAGSNGWIEPGLKIVEGQIRALRKRAEVNYGIAVDHANIVAPWVVDYAGWLITRYGIGRSGNTPVRLLKG